MARPDRFSDSVHFDKLRTERFSISKQKLVPWFPDANMEVRTAFADDTMKRILIELRAWMLTPIHYKYEAAHQVPATWWDHVKQDLVYPVLHKLWPYNPKGKNRLYRLRVRLFALFPINYTHFKIPKDHVIHVCPHLEISKREPHIEFLMMQDKDPMWKMTEDGL